MSQSGSPLENASYWQDVSHLITQVIRAPYSEDGWFLSQNADGTEFAVGRPPGFEHQPMDQMRLLATIVAPRLMSGDLVLQIEGYNRFLRDAKTVRSQEPAPTPAVSDAPAPAAAPAPVAAPAGPASHLKTRCGGCGRKLRMLLAHVGRKTKCTCGATLIVPTQEAVSDALPDRLACEPIDGVRTQAERAEFDLSALDDSLIIARPSTGQLQRALQPEGEQPLGGASRPLSSGLSNPTICDAIRDRAVLRFYYDGGGRVVEPYAHGINSEGDEAIRVYQIGGFSGSDEREGFKVFRVDMLFEMERTGATFVPDRPGHDADDPELPTVHCRV